MIPFNDGVEIILDIAPSFKHIVTNLLFALRLSNLRLKQRCPNNVLDFLNALQLISFGDSPSFWHWLHTNYRSDTDCVRSGFRHDEKFVFVLRLICDGQTTASRIHHNRLLVTSRKRDDASVFSMETYLEGGGGVGKLYIDTSDGYEFPTGFQYPVFADIGSIRHSEYFQFSELINVYRDFKGFGASWSNLAESGLLGFRNRSAERL